MLTKMMAALVMTGALWVAGDAAYQSFGCCHAGSECCYPVSECCFSAASQQTDDCCASGSDCCAPVSECCVAAKGTAPAAKACCSQRE
jgi:hypothetical protein